MGFKLILAVLFFAVVSCKGKEVANEVEQTEPVQMEQVDQQQPVQEEQPQE